MRKQQKISPREKIQRIDTLYKDFLRQLAELKDKQADIIRIYTKTLQDKKLADIRGQLGIKR